MIKKIHDISVMVGRESLDYPGDPHFKRESITSLQNGESFNLSRISLSAHSGTHLDFPLHFTKNGKCSADYDPSRMILDAQVITVEDRKVVEAEDLKDKNISANTAVLLKTENSVSGAAYSGKYQEDYVYIGESAAKYLQEKGVKLIGFDYNSVDGENSKEFRAHRVFLENDILILEGLNLSQIKDGNYLLFALSLKIPDCEASPVRAVLLEME